MATLRRYSIVKTPKHSRLWTPDRVILLAFCAAVGGGVFMTMNSMQFGYRDAEGRFDGIGIGIPIASHLATAVDRPGNRQRLARPTDDPQYAQQAAQRARRATASAELALERHRNSAQLFHRRNNVDRTPVATIAGGQAAPAHRTIGGFRTVTQSPHSQGFREIPRWQPSGN